MAVGPRTEPAELNTATRQKNHVIHLEHPQDTDVQMREVEHAKSQDGVNGVLDVNSLRVTDESDNTTQHKPRRKFAPQAVETTTRSSRKGEDNDTATSPAAKRKFAPEPIETTSKSSKNKDVVREEEKPSRPRRKFAVEPVETSSTSSKEREKKPDGVESGARPKRRFAVEPVETSTRNSKEKEEEKATKPRRKFAVEPVETSAASSRKKKDLNHSGDEQKETPSRSSSGGRKFAPELVGTAKASFRKNRIVGSAVPKWLRDEVAEDEGSWSAPEPESKFSAANLAKRTRAETRRHSYTVPDMPTIQSDSSEEEAPDQTPGYVAQHIGRDRVEKVSKHGLNHEHQKQLDALKTLREQAVAAYGHQEDNVPFNHYGGESGDEDDDQSVSVGKLSIKDNADPSLFRRMSHHDLHLVMEDMRRHHDQLEQAKQDLQEDTAGISRFSAAALAARHHLRISNPTGTVYPSRHEPDRELQDGDDELAKMRKAASPPMQGNEIKFPFSNSPRMTRCDPDQAPRPRRHNSEETPEHDIGVEGMWSVHVSPAKSDAPAGLWGGLCRKDETHPTQPATPLRSGLQTPAFTGSRTPAHGTKTPRKGQMWLGAGSAFLPLTPPRSKNEKSIDSFTVALDQKLSLERQIDEEFSPRVITQIYNYLSLGYPPLARPFDEELSKISRISLLELRKGDRSDTGTMKGHIGAPETEGEAEEDEDGRVKGCRRWEALRLYVREWARQSPGFAEQRALPNIGTGMWGNNAPVRKGSWGF